MDSIDTVVREYVMENGSVCTKLFLLAKGFSKKDIENAIKSGAVGTVHNGLFPAGEKPRLVKDHS
jgi:hypothetical protein